MPAPTLCSVSPNQGPTSGGTSVTLTGARFVGATSVKFDTAAATSFTVISDTTIIAVAPAGAGTVQVTVTNSSGPSNGVAYTYVPVPVLTSAAPNQGPLGGGNTVTLNGTSLTTVSSVKFGTTAASSFTVLSDTVVTVSAPAGAGTVPITVASPGGTSNGLSYTYVPAPVVTSVVPNQGPVGGGNTVTLTGSNFATVSSVRFGTTAASSFTVVSGTQITATVPPGVAGPVPVTVTSSGGTSSPTPYYYIGLPVLSDAVPDVGPVAGGNTVTLTGSNLLTVFSVKFGAVSASSFTLVSDNVVTAVAPAGSGTVPITLHTIGGTSNGVPYTYLPAPVLGGLLPDHGPAAGGNSVTLEGTDLTTVTSVDFGGTPTSFTVLSDTRITATAPAGAAGPVAVTATGPGGTSDPVTYTRVAAPVVTSVVPNQGPVGGGDTVTLTGSNFATVSSVSFGASPASSFTVVSGTQITATVPPGVAGPVPVTVTSSGGTSSPTVFYYHIDVPFLSDAVPDVGPVEGGNTVTLTGSNLLTVFSVKFGVVSASSFTLVNDNVVTAVAPAGSGTVEITLHTIGGTSNGVPYTYLPVPSLEAVVPDSGPAAGGNSVTLEGSDLGTITSVDFGGTPADFTVLSDTRIVATVPGGAAGAVDVTVTGPGGISDPVVYTRVAAPAI
ncbi:IPT/TIG domain-containing protein [Streptomyces kaniharaensis]|uniref:IPT/TIG domain-containing protein n=1 Tax=Streptomyces kaniharaensis TaxID=212423 RepID=UPI0018A83DD6|nr:IPT/TIG domain-containing protein [Streptomyces kaniharaensis]